MRLIDADAFKERMFKGGYTGKWSKDEIVGVIDSQPTVYDMDKVVKQLEKEVLGKPTLEEYNNGIYKAIEIVKGGGQGE